MDRFQELSSMAVDELSQIFARMDDATVRPLLEHIKTRDRIFLMGAGREGISTRSFAMRLTHLGKKSYWVWDDTTPSMGPGDLFICSCGSANVPHENTICENVKKTGATLALVTASCAGPILSMADVILKMPGTAFLATYASEEDHVPTKQMMGNQFEQALYVLYDVLVMMLAEELGQTKEIMETRHRNVE